MQYPTNQILDCKYYAEQSLKSLGYTVHNKRKTSMSSSDAVIIYTGLHTLLETQESYRQVVYFKILLNISDNNEMQKIFYEIMPKITRDVEQSNAPYSTSFYVENTEVIETGGQSLDVEILCRFYYEHDWINEF